MEAPKQVVGSAANAAVWVNAAKFGMPMVIMTPTTNIVISSSYTVNPCCFVVFMRTIYSGGIPAHKESDKRQNCPDKRSNGNISINIFRTLVRITTAVFASDSRPPRIAYDQGPGLGPPGPVTEDKGAIRGSKLRGTEREALAIGGDLIMSTDRKSVQDGLVLVAGGRPVPVEVNEHHPALRPVFACLATAAVRRRAQRDRATPRYRFFAGQVDGVKQGIDLCPQAMIGHHFAEGGHTE